MPTSGNPQVPCHYNVRMIHVQGSNGSSPFRRFSLNDCTAFNPSKMLAPNFLARVKKWYNLLCFGINGLYPIKLSPIAHRTGKNEIFFAGTTSPCLRNKMIYLQQGTNNKL